ncbi:hypothetical protein CR513_38898, partial [Mucuna pruriens]
MHETVFRDLGVTLPFDKFEVKLGDHAGISSGVLRVEDWMRVIDRGFLFNDYWAFYKGFKGGFCNVRVKDKVPFKAFAVVGQDFPLY